MYKQFHTYVTNLLASAFPDNSWTIWIYNDHGIQKISSNGIHELTIEEMVLVKNIFKLKDKDISSVSILHQFHQIQVPPSKLKAHLIHQGKLQLLILFPIDESRLIGPISFSIQEWIKQHEALQFVAAFLKKAQDENHQTDVQQQQLIELRINDIKQFIDHQHIKLNLNQECLHYLALNETTERAIQLIKKVEDTFTQLGISLDGIRISKEMLNTNQDVIQQEQNVSQFQLRSALLLDKYESVAKKILGLHLPINGKNLAEHLTPPVSPSAITDALKKHRKSIYTLLQLHPDKWVIIRQFLKPLQGIDLAINNQNHSLNK